MRISDWSSDVCSSDLHRADLLALENSLVADMTRKKVTQEDLDAVLAGKADAVPADSPAIPAVAKYREAQAKAYEDLKQRRQAVARSEEHTSELQSLMRISYAVFCLKKKTNTQHAI